MNVKKSENIPGLGLFVESNFNKNDVIFILEGKINDVPSRESIHIGNNKHIIDKWGTYMNHSFTPNTKIVGKLVIAIQDIKTDSEITFNYNDSEINMACPFEVDNIVVCGKEINKKTNTQIVK